MEQINLLICNSWKIFAFLQCLTLGRKRFMCFCSYQGRLEALLHTAWNRTVSGLRKRVNMYFYNMNLFCIYRKLVKYLYSASRALWIYGYQTFLLTKYLHEYVHAQKTLAVFTENWESYFVILQDLKWSSMWEGKVAVLQMVYCGRSGQFQSEVWATGQIIFCYI